MNELRNCTPTSHHFFHSSALSFQELTVFPVFCTPGPYTARLLALSDSLPEPHLPSSCPVWFSTWVLPAPSLACLTLYLGFYCPFLDLFDSLDKPYHHPPCSVWHSTWALTCPPPISWLYTPFFLSFGSGPLLFFASSPFPKIGPNTRGFRKLFCEKWF